MFDIFSLKDFKMPDGFLWGAGYSGHQVEGNNKYSQCWKKEIDENYSEKSGLACNSYEMYMTDIDLIRNLGLQAFRTSVEWSRIEPSEGTFSEAAAEHYVSFFSTLKERGVKVFATLVHFSHPQWFEEKGHFKKIENLKYFERYLNFIVPKIAPYVDFWNVFNEFNLGTSDDEVCLKLSSLRFHALGYHIIKKYSDSPVSSAHALVQYMPKRPFDRFDSGVADYIDLCDNEFFFHAIRTGEIVYPGRDGEYVPELKNSVDYWAVNSYVRTMIDAREKTSVGSRFSFAKMKMIADDFYLEEINPECIVNNLSRLIDKPVYITENGCSCDNDDIRIAFISVYLAAVRECIDLRCDVRGFLYWSLLDNYEWYSYRPRFGLYSVDRKTFVRTPKNSAGFYSEIIKNNGVSQSIIRKYLKENPTLK